MCSFLPLPGPYQRTLIITISLVPFIVVFGLSLINLLVSFISNESEKKEKMDLYLKPNVMGISNFDVIIIGGVMLGFQQVLPGEIPVSIRQLKYGFRKSVFGANTGRVIVLC